MDILEQIVAWKRIEIELAKTKKSEREIHSDVEPLMDLPVASMSKALVESSNGIIAEYKRRSPSKGWIKEQELAHVVPLEYQRHGAAALSILTDQKFFGGQDDYIRQARTSGVEIPVLYKNFVVDEYQLFQAKACGASAVLLIAACLSRKDCDALLRMAHELRLEVLLEMHSEEETAYAELEPDLCGINNRNLGSFVTDVENSFRLAESLPQNAVKVSESGISNPQIVGRLRQAGFRGFLIGECFMKEEKPGEALGNFIAEMDKINC